MKRALLLFFLAAGAITFSACEKDLSEENGNLPNGGTIAVTGTGSAVANCKACIYTPMCSGSVYRYSDTGFTSTGTPVNYTLHFIKDTTIGNTVYQRINSDSQNDSYYNCNNGVSTIKSINGSTVGGTTLPMVSITQLKANGAVGDSWVDTINTGGQMAIYTTTIISKGAPRMVSGIIYPDVIHTHEQTTLDVPGFGTIPAGQTDYYYAKGVNLIESFSVDDFSGMMILHRVLISATIP